MKVVNVRFAFRVALLRLFETLNCDRREIEGTGSEQTRLTPAFGQLVLLN